MTLRSYAKMHKITLKDKNGVAKPLKALGDEVRKHIIATGENEFEF